MAEKWFEMGGWGEYLIQALSKTESLTFWHEKYKNNLLVKCAALNYTGSDRLSLWRIQL